MIDRDSLRAHIEGKMQLSVVDVAPSPHVVIADFFPQDLYRRILELNPFQANTGQEWISREKLGARRQSTPYHLRRQINFEKDAYEAPPETKSFWSSLSDAFLAEDWFAKQVLRLYPQFFDVRFGEAAYAADFFSGLKRGLFVQRHEKNYNIGPHTDSPHRVFTCIFAFSDRPGFEEFGTQFLRPKDRRIRCSGDLHHAWDQFEVVKTAPYSPNSFLLFFKTRHSFHAVKTLPDGIPNDRYGMQLGYYEPPGGYFKDLSRPDLMEDRTQMSRSQRVLAKLGVKA